MTDLEYAREFFKNDTYAMSTTGATVYAVNGHESVIELKLDDRHRNAMGGVMGGVYYTIADVAFAIASNYDSPFTVTLNSHVTYMTVPKTDVIYAVAKCVHDGGKTCVYDIYINDGTPDGKTCAMIRTEGYKLGERNSFPDEQENPYKRKK